MSNKNKMLSWGIYLASGVAMFFICAAMWGLFSQTDTLQIVKIISDSFIIPGVMFIGLSLIGWMASKGAYDIFGYSVRGLFSLWKKESYFKTNDYYDYKTKKDKERKPFNKEMMIVGLIFFVLGLIGTVVFLIIE